MYLKKSLSDISGFRLLYLVCQVSGVDPREKPKVNLDKFAKCRNTRKASKLSSRGFYGLRAGKALASKVKGYSVEHAINKKNKNGLKSFIAFYLASYKMFDLFRKYKSEDQNVQHVQLLQSPNVLCPVGKGKLLS